MKRMLYFEGGSIMSILNKIKKSVLVTLDVVSIIMNLLTIAVLGTVLIVGLMIIVNPSLVQQPGILKDVVDWIIAL